ncbi:NAD(P)/FAD-dependent oxidoreductase [Dactylosporangium aurantiacum]|uniref:NAD(P)/FAD-dependent oxidoreductase n=1 Tax=Dactylosporangium aurantiacum TaxID=35754 RepID=A0A9Q9IPS5_9ACTN|nr:NAD(P)/FAD-dependent oxidoreductase [Dactylosporangium aurantiacum]MDG6104176.1 NAD(P)/FAD-dependent oxidoreductase [Dactylosporangium aurantiacum]UWZ56818.1 NAD(P)/FAD-dependent oxidoreductase [Dactylosporangium aurantiacum]
MAPHIVVVGGGFAGFHAARRLARMSRGRARITLLNPTDYFLYLPLLPQVAAGVLEPRRVTVSLPAALPGVRLVLGEATHVDPERHEVCYRDPDGDERRLGYDRVVLAAGSVNKLLPIPGLAEHAHGFRGVPEALYLRDHLIRQVELAADTGDPAERAARLTFVAVGAGYTGTEVVAHCQLAVRDQLRHYPELAHERVRWMLLDVAPRVLPELSPRLSRIADRVLRERGVEVLTGCSVAEALADRVRLTDGRSVPTRTLIWCVGVRPDPLIEDLGLRTEQGRLVVDEYLTVPGYPDVFACGDAAAVPDLTRPGRLTPMTAQHAVRQGAVVAHNVAASFGIGRRRRYKHRDLGFLVDLGGPDGAANPLGLTLSGWPAKFLTRGYHLRSLPGNRRRVVADWVLDAVAGRPAVELGLVPGAHVPLDTAAPERISVPT